MAQLDNRYAQPTVARAGVAVDEGLRSYMLGVYNYMAGGVALTGVAAYLTYMLAVQDGALTPFGQAIYTSPLRWVVMLAPLGFVLYLGFRLQQMSVGAAQVAFWLFAA